MQFSLSWNADFVDSQYKLWKSDPDQVSREWRIFFEGFELAGIPEYEAPKTLETAEVLDRGQVLRQSRVDSLVYRYREIGHLLACLDPLANCPTSHPLLDLDSFGLTEDDLDRTFYTPHIAHMGEATLSEIIKMLRATYCRSVGVEYMHIQDPHERMWLQKRMEPVRNRPDPGGDAKRRIFEKLCEATLFEQFLHTRYIGQKRFSIEGAEVVVAMLDTLVDHIAAQGYREMIVGMAHRGRLNVQANILEKPYESIFCEFEDDYDQASLVGSGDVKYHTGYMSDITTAGGRTLRTLLATNPSHLEAVDPVVEGIARARQEQYGAYAHNSVLPLLIHGDAAFSGQGVVFETLNLSQLDGFHTGGTIHIVINNQIGFTTLPEDARSTRYSTDVAKMLMAPIFHIHGEDPIAAVHIMKLAADYRSTFGKDVVIDVVCYRRYGHNEGDEPYYTQPRMYDRIRERPPAYEIFGKELLREEIITEEEIERTKRNIGECLEKGYEAARKNTCAAPISRFYEEWDEFDRRYSHEPVESGVPEETLISIVRKANAHPEGFSVHSRLDRILNKRLETIEKGEGIDWAGAEMLAFGSLLIEGISVRLSGQDSRRGTFSQRHSMLVDTKTGEHYTPLNHIREGQARFAVYDSMLSEYGVLGFEYGYSLANPNSLVIWEAQFGDFANNAQVIIDQFIASAEAKWQRLSGLVLLLPHGLEGQGPEHSSARLERYLQLCAEDNIQVCYPTTPAQYFHLLRRQMIRRVRKPLVIMTPKSLLRHPLAVSNLSEMSYGHFREILEDATPVENPMRVILCSGKIYYDLMERREALKAYDRIIVRIEQLYPFPSEQLRERLEPFISVPEWLWVQEEPENQGAWSFVRPRLQDLLGKSIRYIGRPASASPATGYMKIHKELRAAILTQAIG